MINSKIRPYRLRGNKLNLSSSPLPSIQQTNYYECMKLAIAKLQVLYLLTYISCMMNHFLDPIPLGLFFVFFTMFSSFLKKGKQYHFICWINSMYLCTIWSLWACGDFQVEKLKMSVNHIKGFEIINTFGISSKHIYSSFNKNWNDCCWCCRQWSGTSGKQVMNDERKWVKEYIVCH